MRIAGDLQGTLNVAGRKLIIVEFLSSQNSHLNFRQIPARI